MAAAAKDEIVLTTDGPPAPPAPLPDDLEDDAQAIRASLMPRPPSEEAISKFQAYGSFV